MSGARDRRERGEAIGRGDMMQERDKRLAEERKRERREVDIGVWVKGHCWRERLGVGSNKEGNGRSKE